MFGSTQTIIEQVNGPIERHRAIIRQVASSRSLSIDS